MNDIFPIKIESILKSDWGAYHNSYAGSGGSYIGVSFAVTGSIGSPIQIRVRSSLDLSSYTGYATIYFTKTTD